MKNRTPKFRVWDKKQGIMVYFDFNHCDSNFVWDIGSHYETRAVSLDSENVSIMQYIGLKDKNGEEIYEGDILERQGVETWDETGKARCVVEDIRHLDHIMFHNGFEIEVIGNVFEDKDLLNK